MDLIFAGSPGSSANILESLCSNDDVNIKLVITQPDKKSGRGRLMKESPVALCSRKHGIQTVKPENLDRGSLNGILKASKCDFLVVVAYGKIIPKWLLDHPKICPINVHFSLLPEFRGASPVHAALLENKKVTGISMMKMTEGLDEGPVFSSHEVDIIESYNKEMLESALTKTTIQYLYPTLKNIMNKKLVPVSQDEALATYTNKISKESGLVIFDQLTNQELINKFRAFQEWPTVFFHFNNKIIKIKGLKELSKEESKIANNQAHSLCVYKFGLCVKTSDGMIVITHIQIQGKNIIGSNDIYNSYRNFFK
tara:strand:+ start:8447 stop:9379 length:933 start_codon:yes stop_codon:yes gene_type:complete